MPRLFTALAPFLLAPAVIMGTPQSRAETSVSGAYLAARHASGGSDYSSAATYYAQALLSDPANPLLQESALIAYLGTADFDRAVVIAREMGAAPDGSQIAALVLLAERGRTGDFDGVLSLLKEGINVGPLVGVLAEAWAELGRGHMSDAVRSFDRLSKMRGLEAFGLYHKALALASVGDFEGADQIFSGEAGRPMRATRRGVQAHVQVLSQLERNADALALLDAAFAVDLDPALSDIRARLVAGERLPFTMVGSAVDGLAETFYTVAGALNSETPDAYTLVYARLGEYLRPGLVDAILMTAAILEQQEQFDLATAAYARIPRDDPAFHAAELGRADALVAADRTEAAIEVLEQLTRSHPDLPGVWSALGDTLRREERYGEAARAYDKAISLFDTPEAAQWFLFYARGIAHERTNAWDKAESDLRTALRLEPEQPQVLNYLGYSYVEKQENLTEALTMIERAVAARPEDGYIIDSLGWALFRLGRYEESVVQMERAVERMPADSLVNDHLGDVYWAVGRAREAAFQWRRALSFGPETEKDAVRIRRKLEVGLDAVLAEEGTAPLKAVLNGN